MSDSAGRAKQEPLLDVHSIGISFGGLRAVHEFSLRLPAGALYGLIGPNGAGKTTVFNLLTGVYRPDAGSIRLQGRELAGLRPHEIAMAGLARTFQNIRLLGELSVLDNVRLAAQLRTKQSYLGTFLRTPAFHERERSIRQRSIELIELFGLGDSIGDPAGDLSYGSQRRVEMARAIATGPQVLLLDEPAAGLNPQEKKELAQVIRDLRDRFRVSILLIEHDMGLVMDCCERITVLDYGEIIADGTPKEVQSSPEVIAAYLGTPTE